MCKMQSTEQSNNMKNDTILSNEIENNLNEVKKKLTENSLAWEMLKEQKRTIKRLFYVIFVLIFLWFATVVGFGLYLNQFDFTDTITEETIDAEQIGDSNIVGGVPIGMPHFYM